MGPSLWLFSRFWSSSLVFKSLIKCVLTWIHLSLSCLRLRFPWFLRTVGYVFPQIWGASSNYCFTFSFSPTLFSLLVGLEWWNAGPLGFVHRLLVFCSLCFHSVFPLGSVKGILSSFLEFSCHQAYILSMISPSSYFYFIVYYYIFHYCIFKSCNFHLGLFITSLSLLGCSVFHWIAESL